MKRTESSKPTKIWNKKPPLVSAFPPISSECLFIMLINTLSFWRSILINVWLKMMSLEFWIIFIYIYIYLFTTIQNFPQVPDKRWSEKWALQTFGYGYSIQIQRLCIFRAACLLNGQWNIQKYRSSGMTERCLHELMVYSMILKENKMMIICWKIPPHIFKRSLSPSSLL